MKRIFILLLSVIGCGHAFAQVGSLDLSFGQKGSVFTDFGAAVNINGNVCKQILLSSDGSFFLVFEMNEQSMVTHRMPDGSLDKNFGHNGYSSAVFMREPSAVLQPDGKIVLGGFTMVNNTNDFVLARLNTNGTLDPAFSGDGVLSFDFSSTADYLNGIAVQTDGKIIAVGHSTSQVESYGSMARLNTDGSFDNSFSQDGKLLATTANSYNAVAVQADGKIVVAGNVLSYIVVARYLSNAEVDNSFSGNGATLISAGAPNSAKALVIQPDEKILVGGLETEAGSYNFLLLRLLTGGMLDPTFSGDGKQTTNFGGDEIVEGLALQADGKIIAVGSTISGAQADFAIARYNADGSADNGFSGDGKQTTPIGSNVDFAGDVVLQSDRILVAGWSKMPDGYNYTVVRYHSDGSLDPTFSENGKMVDYKPAGYTDYKASLIQKDGKIIAAGFANTGKGFQFAVARYDANGSLDPDFGQNGKQTIDFGFGTSIAYDVALQPDGGIVVAGFAGGENNHYIALARLNPNGTPDSSFHYNGQLVVDDDAIGLTIGQYAKIVLLPDNRILIAANTDTPPSTGDIVLVRCFSNGAIDPTFGNGGKVVTNLGSTSDRVFDLLLQADGKPIIVGAYNYNAESKLAVVRYSKDGLLDPAFGNGGIVITNISSRRDEAFAGALQTDGRIIVAGNITTSAGNDLLLVRYNTDGSFDNSFSNDGKLVFDMGSTSEVAMDVVVQDNGKIITAGYTHDGRGNVPAIACFHPDGSFDSAFSSDGKIIGEPDRAMLFALAIDGNRLYAVGSAIHQGTNGGIVAAYQLEPSCPSSFTVSVPDAFSLDKGVDPNTVYPGYALASHIDLSSKVSGGHAPYSYLWSNGSSSQRVTVSPSNTTNYILTVTDAAGCKVTITKQVYVVDVHCGNNNDKVSICQASPGNEKAKSICIATSAVAAQLKNGSKLGMCIQGSVTSREEDVSDGEPVLSVWPNPSSSSFKLQLNNPVAAEYVLVVRDAMGRVVEQRKIDTRRVIEIGTLYRPGVYFVSLAQGARTITVRIAKE